MLHPVFYQNPVVSRKRDRIAERSYRYNGDVAADLVGKPQDICDRADQRVCYACAA